MRKRVFILMTALVMAFGISACGTTEEAAVEEENVTIEDSESEPEVDGRAYGYAGSDPVEAAVYKYLAEEVSKDYDDAEVHIPTVGLRRFLDREL